MAGGDSWWLKVKRAQHHMVEIQRLLRAYEESHPYNLIPVGESKHDHKRLYRLVMDDPDPFITIILGEFIHNLRSALDHIVVACSARQERKHAAYPVTYIDPRARDGLGQFLNPDADARDAFERCIRGLTAAAETVVIGSQPYAGGDVETARIGVINRLENADKHRQLIVVSNGLHDPIFEFNIAGYVDRFADRLPSDHFAENGAIIEFDPPPFNLEMDVQVSGTPIVTVKVSRIGGNQPPIDIPIGDCILDTRFGLL